MRCSTVFEKRAHIPITKRILKTAEPTMVPMPTSEKATKTPITEVNSSGKERVTGLVTNSIQLCCLFKIKDP